MILGINAGPFADAQSVVPGLMGCRSYRDTVITSAADVPTAFPGQDGANNTVSIRPHPDYFLTTGAHYDPAIEVAISAMIQDGCTRFGVPGLAPQLSSWHEAGNLLVGQYGLTAQKARSVHVKMQNLVNAVNANNIGAGVGYGPIWYGPVTGDPNGDVVDWFPTATYPMDWYGIDVYWNTQFDLSTLTKIDNYLTPFKTVVQGLSGIPSPKIVVPECNTHLEANRPNYFKNLANWLSTNNGRRMMTFFKAGGNSGGAWDPTDQPTIDALNYVVANYG